MTTPNYISLLEALSEASGPLDNRQLFAAKVDTQETSMHSEVEVCKVVYNMRKKGWLTTGKSKEGRNVHTLTKAGALAITAYRNKPEPKPIEPKPEPKPIEPKPIEPKPIEPKPEPKPIEPKPEPKPIEPKPIEPKPEPKPIEPKPEPAYMVDTRLEIKLNTLLGLAAIVNYQTKQVLLEIINDLK